MILNLGLEFAFNESEILKSGPYSQLCSFSGPNRGHYIAIVKSYGFWLVFDDDIMEVSLT